MKRLPKNPDRVVSVGDDVVTPFDRWIEHREKQGKVLPERKNSFYQSRRVLGINQVILYQNKVYRLHLGYIYIQRKIEYILLLILRG